MLKGQGCFSEIFKEALRGTKILFGGCGFNLFSLPNRYQTGNCYFLVISRMFSHAMFVPEPSTVTLWDS